MNWKSRLVRLAVPVTFALAIATQLPVGRDTAANAVLLDEYEPQKAAERFDNESSNVSDGFKAANIGLLGAGGIYVIASGAAAAPIADVAATTASVSLSQFSHLAQQTGVAGTLQRAGDNTAFLPTNEALTQLDPALLKPENKEKLGVVLRSHILRGRYTLAEIKNAARQAGSRGKQFTTLAGTTMTATVAGESLLLNGVPIGGSSEIPASNGVIYPVDTVLH